MCRENGSFPSTPFVIGASDGVLSNLGVNAIEPGVVAATIGTSGAIRTVVNRPVTDPKGRTFCYALTEDLWVVGGPVNNGGMLFRWVRDEFAASEVETAKGWASIHMTSSPKLLSASAQALKDYYSILIYQESVPHYGIRMPVVLSLV